MAAPITDAISAFFLREWITVGSGAFIVRASIVWISSR
jgi:hypothetical protein